VLRKSLSPNTDLGRFDLTINGTTTTSNGDGGSVTKLVPVGNVASLSEAASSGSPTGLTDYGSTFGCPHGITMSTNTGTAGSFTVPLSSGGTTITCTITNTRKTTTVILKKSLLGDTVGRFDLTINGSTTSNVGDGGSVSKSVNVDEVASLS